MKVNALQFSLRLLGFLLCMSLFSGSMATLANPEAESLPLRFPLAQQGFEPEMGAGLIDEDTIRLSIDIPENHYLYADKFTFSVSSAKIDQKRLPAPLMFHDEFFGDTYIYRGQIDIELSLKHPLTQSTTLLVEYQGCSDEGICYPPSQQILNVTVDIPPVIAEPVIETEEPAEINLPIGRFTALPDAPDSYSLLPLLTFFGLGLLLAFTPCLFPVLPVLLTLVTGNDQNDKHWPRLAAYVGGFIVVYALVALIAGLSSSLVSAFFQSQVFLILAFFIYTGLGLAMFGFWTFDLSNNRLANRIDQWIRQQKPSTARGAVLGVFSALLSTPCITPPLAGILLYIAQSGEVAWGMLEIIALSLGMVAPLVALAFFGRQWLPKTGPWLIRIQKFLGLILFGMGLWIISPLLPDLIFSLAIILLLGVGAAISGLFSKGVPYSMGRRSAQILVISCLAIFSIGWLGNVWHTTYNQVTPTYPVGQVVTSLSQLEKERGNRPALIFFTAQWCRYCPTVAENLAKIPLLQDESSTLPLFIVDLTTQTADNVAITQHFQVYGSPTIVWVGANGENTREDRIVGLTTTENILELIEAKLSSKAFTSPAS